MEKFLLENARNLHTLVFKIHRRLRNESLVDSPLTFSEETVLAALKTQPHLTGAELARIQNITAQSMTVIIKKLTHRELVRSHRNQLDRRRKELTLTDRGAALIHAIQSKRHQWLVERINRELTPEEIAVVNQAIPLLRRVLEKPEPSREEELLEDQ